MRHHAWFPYEDDALRDFVASWGSEYSWQAIADRLGRTKGSVYGRARTLGLRRQPPDEEEETE